VNESQGIYAHAVPPKIPYVLAEARRCPVFDNMQQKEIKGLEPKLKLTGMAQD
jgi:hypothetical protein